MHFYVFLFELMFLDRFIFIIEVLAWTSSMHWSIKCTYHFKNNYSPRNYEICQHIKQQRSRQACVTPVLTEFYYKIDKIYQIIMGKY